MTDTPVAPGDKKKRQMIWASAAVAVLAVLVVGGVAWHAQPSFCSAICHRPMTAYVEEYATGASSSLASAHASSDIACVDCHKATLGQQVAEATSFISGDYVYEEATGKLASRGDELATGEFCLRSGCHDMTPEELTESTADMDLNPHAASAFHPNQIVACSQCHKGHDQSVLYCTQCHVEITDVPEGWTTVPKVSAQK